MRNKILDRIYYLEIDFGIAPEDLIDSETGLPVELPSREELDIPENDSFEAIYADLMEESYGPSWKDRSEEDREASLARSWMQHLAVATYTRHLIVESRGILWGESLEELGQLLRKVFSEESDNWDEGPSWFEEHHLYESNFPMTVKGLIRSAMKKWLEIPLHFPGESPYTDEEIWQLIDSAPDAIKERSGVKRVLESRNQRKISWPVEINLEYDPDEESLDEAMARARRSLNHAFSNFNFACLGWRTSQLLDGNLEKQRATDDHLRWLAIKQLTGFGYGRIANRVNFSPSAVAKGIARAAEHLGVSVGSLRQGRGGRPTGSRNLPKARKRVVDPR